MIKKFIRVILGILTTLAVFYFFRAIGWMGMACFFIGMGVSAALILSKNPIVMSIVTMTGSEKYIDELMKDEEKESKSEQENQEDRLNETSHVREERET